MLMRDVEGTPFGRAWELALLEDSVVRVPLNGQEFTGAGSCSAGFRQSVFRQSVCSDGMDVSFV